MERCKLGIVEKENKISYYATSVPLCENKT